jgi:class 3 adenylate cyclase
MSDGPGPLILVVDDVDDNRFTLVRRLKRSGYENVEVAANGREALSVMEAKPVDLVLLDIMMPEMDGYQTLEHIKRDMKLRDVPVIMISAIDEIDSVVRCIELGAEDYLPKPFNSTLLKARIGASLDKKRMRDKEISYLDEIRIEKQRSDDLLNVILPAAAVRELKSAGAVQPRRYDGVAIMFVDIVDFTAFCDRHRPEEVVGHLQALVESFEEIALTYGLEKIKTIGDAFMASAGLLRPVDAPLQAGLDCALAMCEAAGRIGPEWQVRAGVHRGPVVGGVVGKRQFLFDVWGDTVNVAARLVGAARPGAVALTESDWRELGGDRYRARALGAIAIKGKGLVDLVECAPASTTR